MSDDHHPDPRPWYKRKRYYLLAAFALVIITAAAVCMPPLLQPMGKPGRFDDELDKAIALVQPRTGNDAWPIIERLAKINTQITAEEIARREAEPDYTPVNGLFPSYDTLFLPEGAPPQHPDDPQHAIIARRVLARLDAEDFWKEFDALADCGYSAPPRPRGVPLNITQPVGGDVRALYRLLAARMKLASRAGDQGEAVACLRRCLDLARLNPVDHGVISPLVRIAIEAAALNALREECAAGRFGADALRSCDDILRRIEPMRADHYFATEHVQALDLMELTHTDDGNGSGYLNLTAVPAGMGLPAMPSRAGVLAGVFIDSKAQSRTKYESYIQRFSDDMTSDEPAPTIMARNKSEVERLDSRREMFTGLVVSALALTPGIARQREMNLDGTRLVVALERYYADNGCYPATLDALTPTYLDKVPIDRYTMQPFRYVPDQSEHPSHALLYSIGYDLLDNAGRENPNLSAMSKDARNTDFILARLRPPPPPPPTAPD